MCCAGCAAVADAIMAAGLGDYYRLRSEPAGSARERVPEALAATRIYDDPQLAPRFGKTLAEGLRESELMLEGINCAACVWLSERRLSQLPGVLRADINYSTRRARVVWDPKRVELSAILDTLAAIGYRARPYEPDRHLRQLEAERRAYLMRLGVSAALGMQVMILAVALYFGAAGGMEPAYRRFFSWASLLLVTPIYGWGAWPFLQAAWRGLRARMPGMDLPVAVGLTLAFGASIHATVTGRGEVYFDSVVMFTTFLLATRYLELAARARAARGAQRLLQATPASATRLVESPGGDRAELIPAIRLEPGDRVRVGVGETVPADGVVLEGRSDLDESLLTGESRPLARVAGSRLIGGSINVTSPLVMAVERVGPDTVLAGMLRLLERAQAEKPAVARLADRVAAWFVSGVLTLAAAVAAWWWWHGSPDWLAITVAVLVVTCPCALSLATPAALSAATDRLARMGLLPTRGHALEGLARAREVIFDKTGTLTTGRMELAAVQTEGGLGETEAVALAAALEGGSSHPLAVALRRAAPGPLPAVAGLRHEAGKGVAGESGGETWRLGNPAWAAGGAVEAAPAGEESVALLAGSRGTRARFTFHDSLRPEAADAVSELRELGLRVSLLSGDHEHAVRRIARAAGIADVAWDMTPQAKLAALAARQASGETVAMIGDGVNDAPVLAGADVSVAVGETTALAAANADMVLPAGRLDTLPAAVRLARRTRRIVAQNLGWAVAYNLLALPAAAAGWVVPWMAALGMSLSSLVVVANALRLARN